MYKTFEYMQVVDNALLLSFPSYSELITTCGVVFRLWSKNLAVSACSANH